MQKTHTNLRGLNIHLVSCKRKQAHFIRRVQGHIDLDDESFDTNEETTNCIIQEDVLSVININSTEVNLPDYVPNVKFPTKRGKAGKNFIKEITFWLNSFNVGSDFRCIASKVFMTLPSLLLQKPSRHSKAKDHIKCLEERLKLWDEGNIEEILRENRRIQNNLTATTKRTSEDSARSFAKLMWKGKVKAAIKMLTNDYDNGVLQVTDDVYNTLKEKHPSPAPIHDDVLLHGPIDKLSRGYFDSIDETMIATATRLTKGSGGPSQFDSEQFNHILLSKKFKKEGKDLREEIARLARLLASEIIDPKSIESLLACRLIALNKNPGVRPIGIGEVLRRIIGKSVSWVLKNDVQEAAGPLQTCTGLKNGAEAAIHSMREIFQLESTDAVILVDAENAFNSLNRKVALHNIQVVCQPMSKIMINTYRAPSRLILFGSKEILSREGTTQGDNLAMSFYALGLAPLLEGLKTTVSSIKQVWLADDATGAGTLNDLKKWWDTLLVLGRKYGYYINEGKSWLIAKNDNILQMAGNIFKESSIKFTKEGKRHLGAAIGSDHFRNEYVKEKVENWCEEIETLSKFAKSEPQAAFAAFTHGQQSKFNYFMRTIPEMEEHMTLIDEKLRMYFYLHCSITVYPPKNEIFSRYQQEWEDWVFLTTQKNHTTTLSPPAKFRNH